LPRLQPAPHSYSSKNHKSQHYEDEDHVRRSNSSRLPLQRRSNFTSFGSGVSLSFGRALTSRGRRTRRPVKESQRAAPDESTQPRQTAGWRRSTSASPTLCVAMESYTHILTEFVDGFTADVDDVERIQIPARPRHLAPVREAWHRPRPCSAGEISQCAVQLSATTRVTASSVCRRRYEPAVASAEAARALGCRIAGRARTHATASRATDSNRQPAAAQDRSIVCS
jgi:hypothetical protein